MKLGALLGKGPSTAVKGSAFGDDRGLGAGVLVGLGVEEGKVYSPALWEDGRVGVRLGRVGEEGWKQVGRHERVGVGEKGSGFEEDRGLGGGLGVKEGL